MEHWKVSVELMVELMEERKVLEVVSVEEWEVLEYWKYHWKVELALSKGLWEEIPALPEVEEVLELLDLVETPELEGI